MYPTNDITVDQPLFIRELQSFLRFIARYFTSIPMVNVDGVYGTRTGAAVGAFQKRFGLPVTEIVDFITWTTIFSEYRRLKSLFSVPVPSTLPLKQGDRNAQVAQLNEWLSMLSKSYDNLPTVILNNLYDEQTQAAVVQMQRLLLLPPNGITNAATWNGISASAQTLRQS